MKRIAAVALLMFATALTVHTSMEAHAAELRLEALTSTDAGPTNTNSSSNLLGANAFYTIQCANPFCVKFSATSPAGPVCSTDFKVDERITGYDSPDAGAVGYTTFKSPSFHTYRFQAAQGYPYVAVKSLDAGNPDCQLFNDKKAR